MDFSLSDDDRLLQQSVRDFVEEQANSVWRDIERTKQLPASLIAGAQELGLLGLSIPEQYGGLGLNVTQKALVHEQLGRGPWGLSTFISVHTGIGCVGIVRFGSDEQKKKYLPKMAAGEWIGSFALTEPNAGSDAGAMTTSAVLKGNEWILNGTKTFITNAPKAHHFMVFAKTESGISAFIVDADRPGVRIGQVYETIGHSGSNPSEVVMEDCRIPKDALVGAEGKGFDLAKRTLAEGRTTLGARSVGTAQKAMEITLEYANARTTFGKPLSEHQALAFRFAQMSARTEAARLCCYRAAWMLDQGKPAVHEAAIAKLNGAEWSWQTVDECFQIFGGNAYINGEYMIERMWRDLRVARIYDGSSEVQQILIAHQLRKGNVQSPVNPAPALADRVAVITGGGGGIGRATALELAALGARVVVADLDEGSAQQSAHAVVERGGQASAFRVDVTSPDEHVRLMAHALQTFGRVDVMVNNAGVAQGAALLDWTPEMVERVTSVNQHGVLYAQAAARVMGEAGRGGVIINVGSIYGQLATLYCIVYQATKAAVEIMTKVAAHELAPQRIRVVNVAPGVVDTHMIEDYRKSGLAPRMAKKHMRGELVQPEQVARVIALLATDAASAVNGTTVFADDGFSAFK